MRLPTLFIPHGGGPCFFMDWTMGPADTWVSMGEWLRGLAGTIGERPRAILMISGHWEEAAFTVSTARNPGMIFDYYGFPPHTYELRYPAPGNPELAQHVHDLLSSAGLPNGIDANRGFDHGVFVPLMLVYPDADIPVVSLSLRNDLDPELHLCAGQALSSLRDEGVLIIGSGMSYHNMHDFNVPRVMEQSRQFDSWLTDVLVHHSPEERWQALCRWQEGDCARASHPREEHLIPLMVAAGAGESDPGSKIFSDLVGMAIVSAFRFG